MSAIEYQQTLEQQAQIEELLTKDGNFDDVLHLYLSEHGLPIDSTIKGL